GGVPAVLARRKGLGGGGDRPGQCTALADAAAASGSGGDSRLRAGRERATQSGDGRSGGADQVADGRHGGDRRESTFRTGVAEPPQHLSCVAAGPQTFPAWRLRATPPWRG